MASTQKAYPNPDARPIEKARSYFSAADLDEFFRTCPPELVPQRFLRMIQGMFIAVEQRLKKRLHGDTFEFYLAVEDYRRGCRYKSERTVRYNLRPAVKQGFLEVAHRDEDGNTHHIWIRPRTERDRGLYRRVTTYRLSVSVLLKWREMHQGRSAEVMPIRKPTQPVAPPLPPAPAAPAQPKRAAEAPKLTPRQRKELAQRIDLYEKGATEIRYANGSVGSLRPGDRDYIKPMDRTSATLAACKSMGVGDEARGLEAHGCAMQQALEAAKEMQDGGGP